MTGAVAAARSGSGELPCNVGSGVSLPGPVPNRNGNPPQYAIEDSPGMPGGLHLLGSNADLACLPDLNTPAVNKNHNWPAGGESHRIPRVLGSYAEGLSGLDASPAAPPASPQMGVKPLRLDPGKSVTDADGRPSPPSPSESPERPSGWNRNVVVAILFTFWSGAGRGVWAFATLSVYLKLLKGSGLGVGIAEGAQGAMQILVAPLCGYFGDRIRRDTLLRIAAMGCVVACLVLLGALLLGNDWNPGGTGNWTWMDDTVRFYFFLGGLGLWGAYQGAWTTGVETIYADSVPQGQRSLFNVYKFAALQLSQVVGPIVSVVLFASLGNHWKDTGSGSTSSASGDGGEGVKGPVTHVMVAGVGMCIPAALLLFGFRDESSTPAEKDRMPRRESNTGPESVAGIRQVNEEPELREEAADAEGGGEAAGETEDEAARLVTGPVTKTVSFGRRVTKDTTTDESTDRGEGRRWLRARHVPHIIVASDMISGIGSGMTIKFFPLFFDEAIGLSPVGVNLIYVGLPFFLTAGSFAVQRLSRKIGRVDASMFCGLISAAGLVGLWSLGRVGWPQEGKFLYTGLLLYLVSTLQHCCRPLKKSILMDHVPRSERAKWNSVDSVTRFGWSGSAVFGGLIVDKWGYGASFLVTACFQVVSVWCLGMLRPLIRVDEMAQTQEETPPGSPWNDSFGGTESIADWGAQSQASTFTGWLHSPKHRASATFDRSGYGRESRAGRSDAVRPDSRMGAASVRPDSRAARSEGPFRSESRMGRSEAALTTRTAASHRSTRSVASQKIRGAIHSFAHSHRSGGLTCTTAELQM
eukprot:Hpha_TRINITY_DN15624_c4_g4::TRINITY_DN15624_c4_g4_i1::g.99228::m.99228